MGAGDVTAGDVRAAWADGSVVVSGCDHPTALTVVPVGALRLGADLVATAGSWVHEGGASRFTPRFGARPGSEWVVLERLPEQEWGGGGPWRELARVTVGAVGAAGAGGAPVAVSIDPGGDTVPANLLRFSVSFSRPMAEGAAAGHVHLRDARGTSIPGALLDMPPELWDRARRRLTVLLEPGRIKRGLQPNALAGPPLAEGSTVSLVIDQGFCDETGAELVGGAERTFSVGPPLRARVDPRRWSVRWPEAPGAPLVVGFDRPLDRALAERCLAVVDGNGHPVPGSRSVNEDVGEWRFLPSSGEALAPPQDWRLAIDTRLEDLAGNSVRRVFDRDLDDPADDGTPSNTVVLARSGIESNDG